MSGTEQPDRMAAAEPHACRLLREQLVEVVASIRSHAAMMQGLGFEDPDERPVIGPDSQSPT